MAHPTSSTPSPLRAFDAPAIRAHLDAHWAVRAVPPGDHAALAAATRGTASLTDAGWRALLAYELAAEDYRAAFRTARLDGVASIDAEALAAVAELLVAPALLDAMARARDLADGTPATAAVRALTTAARAVVAGRPNLARAVLDACAAPDPARWGDGRWDAALDAVAIASWRAVLTAATPDDPALASAFALGAALREHQAALEPAFLDGGPAEEARARALALLVRFHWVQAAQNAARALTDLDADARRAAARGLAHHCDTAAAYAPLRLAECLRWLELAAVARLSTP